ncbi:hypothetical protein GGX14DRAFT_392722 [Mycena pura]|uniref:Uncharacterized protein n=1 Tax=Mycena pura TaxID=153505 RepID=A0AAD6YDS4_9AGAR|nr:hypothetical protein GGX14DRAFT_392722 [Mycena pura]
MVKGAKQESQRIPRHYISRVFPAKWVDSRHRDGAQGPIDRVSISAYKKFANCNWVKTPTANQSHSSPGCTHIPDRYARSRKHWLCEQLKDALTAQLKEDSELSFELRDELRDDLMQQRAGQLKPASSPLHPTPSTTSQSFRLHPPQQIIWTDTRGDDMTNDSQHAGTFSA